VKMGCPRLLLVILGKQFTILKHDANRVMITVEEVDS
jgi:hypothetical protein